MTSLVIEFANLLLAALMVGTLFCVWLVLDPAGLSADSYIAVQQQGIRTLNTIMPRLGAATVLATLVAAIWERADSIRFWLLIGTVVCFAAVGLVTRFLNQPINAIVMTWKSDLVPVGWTDLRDAWWKWHFLRLATGIVGFCLLLVATLSTHKQ
jgi:hypothetical protein